MNAIIEKLEKAAQMHLYSDTLLGICYREFFFFFLAVLSSITNLNLSDVHCILGNLFFIFYFFTCVRYLSSSRTKIRQQYDSKFVSPRGAKTRR